LTTKTISPFNYLFHLILYNNDHGSEPMVIDTESNGFY